MVAKGNLHIVSWMPVYAGAKKMPVGCFSCYFALALSLDLLNITTHEGRLFHYVLEPPAKLNNTDCILPPTASNLKTLLLKILSIYLLCKVQEL